MPSACGFSAGFQQVICRNVHCEMLSSMTPIALSHRDSAPGAGAEDCFTRTRRLWRVELGSPPVVVRLDVVPLPPRSSALTVAGCQLGGYPDGRDR